MVRILAVTVILTLVVVRAGLAQQPTPDPVAEAPIRLGVFGFAPRIAVTNLGVDTNVFNTAENPQRDFTFTTGPTVDFWMRTQRGLLSVSGRLDFVYFGKFRSERSINGSGAINYMYRFNRLRPFVTFAGLNTRERPGYEIDVRARRFDNTLTAGADVVLTSKSFLQISARRQGVDYAGEAVFQGRPLNQLLNRRLQGVDLAWRQRLTPLTTWVVRGSGERERFEFTANRNGDSARVMTGFEMGRFALIRGTTFIGYRRLVGAHGGTIPDFSGVTADVNVSYTAPSQSRFSLQVARDVHYSYEEVTPYYVQTGWTAAVTQRITGKWDLQLLGGRDWLAYRGAPNVRGNRVDILNRVGGGLGYQVGTDTRLALDVISYQRQSEALARDYKTLRVGTSVTYGF